jgi:hypothetical protein
MSEAEATQAEQVAVLHILGDALGKATTRIRLVREFIHSTNMISRGYLCGRLEMVDSPYEIIVGSVFSSWGAISRFVGNAPDIEFFVKKSFLTMEGLLRILATSSAENRLIETTEMFWAGLDKLNETQIDENLFALAGILSMRLEWGCTHLAMDRLKNPGRSKKFIALCDRVKKKTLDDMKRLDKILFTRLDIVRRSIGTCGNFTILDGEDDLSEEEAIILWPLAMNVNLALKPSWENRAGS